jgi:hypothetical protein
VKGDFHIDTHPDFHPPENRENAVMNDIFTPMIYYRGENIITGQIQAFLLPGKINARR